MVTPNIWHTEILIQGCHCAVSTVLEKYLKYFTFWWTEISYTASFPNVLVLIRLVAVEINEKLKIEE